MNKHILPSLLLLLLLVTSCAKETKSDAEVYNNSFESGDLTGITNGTIATFNNTKVLGMYNNGGFALNLTNLPDHDLIEISFDLYIHDSWDGNRQAENYIDGPDIWQLKADGRYYINATFSNNVCPTGNICPPQSYPADYPNNYNNPKTGAANVNLPGVCNKITDPRGSTLYKINKRISHTNNTILIEYLDKLSQTNTADPKCDESWSVDNIKVRAINLD